MYFGSSERYPGKMKLLFLGIVFALFAALFTASPLPWADGLVRAQTQGAVPGGALGNRNDAEFWRALRMGTPGTVSLPDKRHAVLVQSGGEQWRAWRNGPVSTWGGWLLAVAAAAILIVIAVRGQAKISEGPSGQTLRRFNNAERVIHWYVAATFVLLAVSGLTILYGRYIFPQVIGPQAFSVMASAALQGHNLFGPLFIVGISAMALVYVRDNLPRAADLDWILKAGGVFGGHVPSWKYNFGEKGWFWLAVTAGAVLSLSGLVMEFPSYFTDRGDLQLANISHAIAAVVVIAVSLGHIYLGLWGVEGALEGMTAGQVDVNWAKQHHDLWAADVMARGAIIPRRPLFPRRRIQPTRGTHHDIA